MSQVVKELTTFAQEKHSEIGENYLPEQAQFDIATKTNEVLFDAGIDSKNWGTINSQISNVTSKIGKEHYFSVENQQFAYLPGGDVVSIYKPGADKVEASRESLAAGLSPAIAAYIQRVYDEAGPEAASEASSAYLASNYKADMAGFRTRVANEHVTNLSLDEAERKKFLPGRKIDLQRSFNDFSEPLLNSQLSVLQKSKLDPGVTFKAFSDQLRDWIFDPNHLPAIVSAGYNTPDEYFKAHETYLASVKEQMEINSFAGQEKLATAQQRDKIEAAKIKTALAQEELLGNMSTKERLLWESPQQVQGLLFAANFVNVTAQSPAVESVFPTANSLLNNKELGDRLTASAQRDLAQDNLVVYGSYITELAKMTRDLLDPEATPRTLGNINGEYYFYLGDSIFQDAKWAEFESAKPERAKMLKDQFDKIKSQFENRR